MGIRTETIVVDATGSAGSAAGNTTSNHVLNGELVAIYLDYHASTPATADVTITLPNAPAATLLTITNSATDAWYFPRYIIHSEAGAALTGTSGGDRTKHPLNGPVKVAIAQGDALTAAVTAYILYED